MVSQISTFCPNSAPAGVEAVQDGACMVLRLKEGDEVIERRLSAEQAWQLMGNIGPILADLMRQDNARILDPLDHPNPLLLRSNMASAGIHRDGNIGLAFSLEEFPTTQIRRTPAQATSLVKDVADMLNLWLTTPPQPNPVRNPFSTTPQLDIE